MFLPGLGRCFTWDVSDWAARRSHERVMVAKDLFDCANIVLQKNIHVANVMIGYDLMIHLLLENRWSL